MSQLKRNIVANFAGNIWQAFMALAFNPLHIEFMGKSYDESLNFQNLIRH